MFPLQTFVSDISPRSSWTRCTRSQTCVSLNFVSNRPCLTASGAVPLPAQSARLSPHLPRRLLLRISPRPHRVATHTRLAACCARYPVPPSATPSESTTDSGCSLPASGRRLHAPPLLPPIAALDCERLENVNCSSHPPCARFCSSSRHHKTFHNIYNHDTCGSLAVTIGKQGVPQFLLCRRAATSCMAAAERSSHME